MPETTDGVTKIHAQLIDAQANGQSNDVNAVDQHRAAALGERLEHFAAELIAKAARQREQQQAIDAMGHVVNPCPEAAARRARPTPSARGARLRLAPPGGRTPSACTGGGVPDRRLPPAARRSARRPGSA